MMMEGRKAWDFLQEGQARHRTETLWGQTDPLE